MKKATDAALAECQDSVSLVIPLRGTEGNYSNRIRLVYSLSRRLIVLQPPFTRVMQTEESPPYDPFAASATYASPDE